MHVGVCIRWIVTYLILRKMLSRSFFMSTRVRVCSRKRSFICCSRTLDSPLKLINISFVFSKRSSLFSQKWSKVTVILHWTKNGSASLSPVSELSFSCTKSRNKLCKTDTYMCLWAWMIALTSSVLTMLNILLQNTPDAEDSTMMSIKTIKAVNKSRFRNLVCVAQHSQRYNHWCYEKAQSYT